MGKILVSLVLLILIHGFDYELINQQDEEDLKENILYFEVDPAKQELKFFWRDKQGENYKNFEILRNQLLKENKELIFAMNGGMYKENLSPLGLYIENGITKSKINKVQNAYGNFYLQPNGIFYLTNSGKPVVITSKKFENKEDIKFATQSGPMLLIDGAIHPRFIDGSVNLNVRNGVGILPNGNILFALSKERINFYDFASFFKQRGCKNALYLDGSVSRAYLPSKNWTQLDGNFGVIIGITEQK